MEFSSSLAAGTAGGLMASLLLRFLWERAATAPGSNTLAQAGRKEAQFLLLHAVWGTALGLLYWLSWGLTAIVGVTWWARGLMFGALCGALLVPVLLMGRLVLRWPWIVFSTLLFDALATSALAGLLCAWSWAYRP